MAEENNKKINELACIIAGKRNEKGYFDFKICPRETGEIFDLLLKRYEESEF